MSVCVMWGSLPSPSVEPSWSASPQGAWRTACFFRCRRVRACVGVVSPLCRIYTPVAPPCSPTATRLPLTRDKTPHLFTFSSRSLLSAAYCLPPTVVNLPAGGRCQKRTKLSKVTAVCLTFCAFHRKENKPSYGRV